MRKEIKDKISAPGQVEIDFDPDKINRGLLDAMPALCLIADADHRIRIANRAFCDLVGRSSQEIEGLDPVSAFTPAEDRPDLLAMTRKVVAAKVPVVFETRVIGADGSLVPVEWHIRPIPDDKSEFRYFYVIGIDISARRKSEPAVFDAQLRLGQIIDSSSTAAFVIDCNHSVIHWNKACERLTGVAAEKVLGTKNHWAAFYSQPRPVMADLVVDGTSDSELLKIYSGKLRRITLVDGMFEVEDFFPHLGERGRWLYFNAAPIRDNDGRIIGAIETLQDVTEYRRTESALLQSESRYRDLFNNMTSGVAVYRPIKNGEDFLIRDFNEAGAKAVKCQREEIIGKSIKEVFPAIVSSGMFDILRKVYCGGHGGFCPAILYADDNLRAWMECQAYRIPSGDIVMVFRDISARKKAEDEIQQYRVRLEELVEERTAKLEAVFSSVRDGIITVDRQMNLIAANDVARNICGHFSENAAFTGIKDHDNSCRKSCLKVLEETLRKKCQIVDVQVECRHEENAPRLLELNSAPLVGKDKKFLGAVLVIRDNTRLNQLERELNERHEFHNIIGKNKRMQEIYRLVENLAQTDTSVLITGETGTGKGLLARAIHFHSVRALKPMIEVNCSALAESLLESELFGHVRGAFTGAIRDKIGRFQLAEGGTILLDEIGDVSPRIQLKLLQVLQEKKYERVGDSRTLNVDVRVIAASNSDLRELVRRGQFREDLYYRLKVLEIALPPLRQRMEDIPLLAEHYFRQLATKFTKDIAGISDECMMAFMKYSWPGNIRELIHAIEHALVVCQDKYIRIEHIPADIREPLPGDRPLPDVLSRHSGQVQDILEKTGGNKARAARLLGISRPTLYRRLKELSPASESD